MNLIQEEHLVAIYSLAIKKFLVNPLYRFYFCGMKEDHKLPRDAGRLVSA